jgi:hypothetical protein
MQPHCFWREALRQLMHSMNMSMVRDKAVGNFVERLQMKPRVAAKKGAKRGGAQPASAGDGGTAAGQQSASTAGRAPAGNESPQVVAGWLELRKGYHTRLMDDGTLVVLRDGVFDCRAGLGSSLASATTRNQLRQQQLKSKQRAPAATVGASTAASLAAQSVAPPAAPAVPAVPLFVVEFDPVSGRLSCDAQQLLEVAQRAYPASKVPSAEGGEGPGAANNELRFGPWCIGVRNCNDMQSLKSPEVAAAAAAVAAPLGSITSLHDLLPGSFEYRLLVQGPADAPSEVAGAVSHGKGGNGGGGGGGNSIGNSGSRGTAGCSVRLALWQDLEQLRVAQEEGRGEGEGWGYLAHSAASSSSGGGGEGTLSPGSSGSGGGSGGAIAPVSSKRDAVAAVEGGAGNRPAFSAPAASCPMLKTLEARLAVGLPLLVCLPPSVVPGPEQELVPALPTGASPLNKNKEIIVTFRYCANAV